MSWCRLICKPWPQHYPRIADEVTANRTTRSAIGTQDEKTRRGQELRRQMDAAKDTSEESPRLTVLPHEYGMSVLYVFERAVVQTFATDAAKRSGTLCGLCGENCIPDSWRGFAIDAKLSEFELTFPGPTPPRVNSRQVFVSSSLAQREDCSALARAVGMPPRYLPSAFALAMPSCVMMVHGSGRIRVMSKIYTWVCQSPRTLSAIRVPSRRTVC